MANSTYLCATLEKKTYPSLRTNDFDAEQRTIAMAVDSVPLLWLAIFRPEDLLSESLVTKEGQSLATVAPVVARRSAGKRLKDGAKRLRPIYGSLDEQIKLLLQAIATVDPSQKFLTIELAEVAEMDDAAAYYERLTSALSFFAGEDIEDPQGHFRELSNLQSAPPYYPPRLLLDSDEPNDDQWEAVASLLGESHFREVPWEMGRVPQVPPLFAAVQAGDLAEVRRLLAAGNDPNAKGPGHCDAPLSAAIQLANSELIALLLEWRADVNDAVAQPLFVAAQAGNLAIVQQLIDAGAHVDYPTLRLCIEAKRLELVQLMVETGIDLNPSPRKVPVADHPLNAAEEIEIVSYLLSKGADVNHISKPLNQAAHCGWFPKVQLLLKHGADPNARDRNGRTPLVWAATGGQQQCVEYLLQLSPTEQDVRTAHGEAILTGKHAIANMLAARLSG